MQPGKCISTSRLNLFFCFQAFHQTFKPTCRLTTDLGWWRASACLETGRFKGYVQPLKCCQLCHRMISLMCSINETPLTVVLQHKKQNKKNLSHCLPQNSFRWALAIQNNYRINTWHSQRSLQLPIHFLPKVFNEALFTALCRPAFLHKT